jgi:chromatin remodeling complex protein RSC6
MVRSTSKSTTPATTTTTKPRAKKAAAAPENEMVSAPVPAAAPVVEEAAPVVEVPSVVSKMSEFSSKLQQLVSLFSTVKNDFKTLEKSVAREMKIAAKASSKKRRSNVNRKPSGFVKPTKISKELADFLGKDHGVEMARTEVSREINAYILAHKLQDKDNGRIIHPDNKLTKLLKIGKEDELTYFNLQRYMKHHFQKAGDVSII